MGFSSSWIFFGRFLKASCFFGYPETNSELGFWEFGGFGSLPEQLKKGPWPLVVLVFVGDDILPESYGDGFFKPWNTRIRHEKQAEFQHSFRAKNTARWTVSFRQAPGPSRGPWMGAEVRRGHLPKEFRMPLLLVLLGAEFAKLSNFGRFRIFRSKWHPKRWPPQWLSRTHWLFFGGMFVNFWSYQNRRNHIIQVNTVAIWIYLISIS